jgi:hypothetical protein
MLIYIVVSILACKNTFLASKDQSRNGSLCQLYSNVASKLTKFISKIYLKIRDSEIYQLYPCVKGTPLELFVPSPLPMKNRDVGFPRQSGLENLG